MGLAGSGVGRDAVSIPRTGPIAGLTGRSGGMGVWWVLLVGCGFGGEF